MAIAIKGPPMTDAQLDEVEAALGRPLPADYREFVKSTPVPEWNRYCRSLFSSPRALIRGNQPRPDHLGQVSLRDESGELQTVPWPKGWTIVGDADGTCERYDFIRDDQPGVWSWDHETLEIRKQADNFAEFLADLRERIGPPPVLEITQHPILGELTWNPEEKQYSTTYAGQEIVLRPRDMPRPAFLALMEELVPLAVAAEPKLFVDSITQEVWENFLMWTDGTDFGLTADTLREHLPKPNSITIDSKLEVRYSYYFVPQGSTGFTMLYTFNTDGKLTIGNQHWHRFDD